jgi:hypothetical protein
MPPTTVARTRTGSVEAPCVSALARRFESSCARRARCAIDRFGEGEINLDPPVRPRAPQFLHHQGERRLHRLLSVVGQNEPFPQAAAREVQEIVDESRHAGDTLIDVPGDFRRAFRMAEQKGGPGSHGCERIAQIMAEYGDELLAQLRHLALLE